MGSVALALGLAILLLWPSTVAAGDPGRESDPHEPQRVELAFRAAVAAWAHNELWRLHRMGTNDSRAALSEQDFALEMEHGWRKPGIGLAILNVHIRGVHAVIRAKVRMEYGRFTREPLRNRPLTTVPTDEVVQSVLVYEEGEWRVNLRQFVGMARY